MSRRKREITGLMNEWDFPHLLELPPGGFRSVFLEFDAPHLLIVCATLEFRQLSVVVGGDGRHIDLVVIFLHELDVGRKLDRPKLPSSSQWLHEIKHDGFRIIARKTGAQVGLATRLAIGADRKVSLRRTAAARGVVSSGRTCAGR